MLANIDLLEYIDLILDWGSSSCLSPTESSVEQEILLHSWKFLPSSTRSHWLLRGHMTSNNETVSRQNLWAGDVAKSMTSGGNSARSPANVVLTDDCSYSEVLWIFSFKISPQATLRFSGNKINFFPRDQSIFKCLLLWSRRLPSSPKQESSLRMKLNPPTELLLSFSQPSLRYLYELTRSWLYVIFNKVVFQVIKEAIWSSICFPFKQLKRTSIEFQWCSFVT